MAGGYMNERCREILDILLKSENYLSLQKIADMLHISRRSIYYDICRINEWLEENGIAELETVRGKGIFIDQEKRAAIKKCTTVEEQRDSYILGGDFPFVHLAYFQDGRHPPGIHVPWGGA